VIQTAKQRLTRFRHAAKTPKIKTAAKKIMGLMFLQNYVNFSIPQNTLQKVFP
jgi:hypothetical protein